MGKYLGFRLYDGKVKRMDFSELIERVNGKLSAWNVRLINKPGWVYPKYICGFVDKTIRSFIWRGSKGKGLYKVRWDKITKPRNLRGLGVRRERDHNKTLLGKLISDLLNPLGKL